MSVEWDNLDQMGRAEMTGYQAGIRDEQARIIKLLKDNERDFLTIEQGTLYNIADEVIALIKGEQK